jgi:flagellar assembly protein FliH
MEPAVSLPGRLVAVHVVADDGDPAVTEAGAERRQAQRDLEAETARMRLAAGSLADAAGRLDDLYRELPARIEAQLVELAVSIARKVLCQELRAGRHEIEPIVREAMADLDARHGVVVHLNPEDLRRSGLASAKEAEGAVVRYFPDPRVSPGECFVQTPDGVVESTVADQLGQIEEALKASVAE